MILFCFRAEEGSGKDFVFGSKRNGFAHENSVLLADKRFLRLTSKFFRRNGVFRLRSESFWQNHEKKCRHHEEFWTRHRLRWAHPKLFCSAAVPGCGLPQRPAARPLAGWIHAAGHRLNPQAWTPAPRFSGRLQEQCSDAPGLRRLVNFFTSWHGQCLLMSRAAAGHHFR